MDLNLSASFSPQDLPLYFSPYKYLAIIITDPLYDGPNSFPAIAHSFSLHLALWLSFLMLQAKKSRSFNDKIIKAIPAPAPDTALKYVILYGASTLWPLATKRAFLVNCLSILMWVEQYLYPSLILSVHICPGITPQNFSNAIFALVISFLISFS